jgi:type VI secretion system Hcp family effector
MNRKRSSWRIAASLAIAVLAVSRYCAADSLFVGAQGRVQGTFRGATSGPAPGMTPVVKFAFDERAGIDPVTLQVNGKRQYTPVRVTKLLDASSAQYLQAAATNETLTNVTINFLGTGPDAKVIVVRSLVLSNAQVVAVEHYSEPDATGAPVVMEQISFNFQKYTWTENAGGLTMSDTVAGPIS